MTNEIFDSFKLSLFEELSKASCYEDLADFAFQLLRDLSNEDFKRSGFDFGYVQDCARQLPLELDF